LPDLDRHDRSTSSVAGPSASIFALDADALDRGHVGADCLTSEPWTPPPLAPNRSDERRTEDPVPGDRSLFARIAIWRLRAIGCSE
jgi:hypothetical protein